MNKRVLRASAAAPLAALLFAAPALAANPALPIGSPLPVSLGAAGTADYDLSVGAGGALSVQLQSGDLTVLLADDRLNTTRDAMAGAATATIGLQPTSTSDLFHVDLSSQNGAQAVLQFTPGAASGGVTSVAGAGGSVSVSVVGGDGGSSVVIDGGSVSVTSGGAAVSVGDGSVAVVNAGSNPAGPPPGTRWAGAGRRWFGRGGW